MDQGLAGAAASPSASPAPAAEPGPPAAGTPVPRSAPPAPPPEAVSAGPAPGPASPADDTDHAIPTLTAEPVGEPGSGRFASGKAIIRHGDNLWTIARRVYGRGMRYTMIWQANDDQIRDPHWIYPGQVFDLPKSAATAGASP
jgi:nucleoid-associated protein YgaU